MPQPKQKPNAFSPQARQDAAVRALLDMGKRRDDLAPYVAGLVAAQSDERDDDE